ncbi:MAG: 50S ribosomal protein L9 [Chloroflexota bacterium]
MKVLLLQDVYNLGRAGDVKKVANGYGRNYLIPHGYAVLATPGAMKMVDKIRVDADKKRAILNEEMGGLAEQLVDISLTFAVRASETGRLYGSVNTRMLAEALSEKIGVEISHRQIDAQPLRTIGGHPVRVRLTVDLIPEISVILYREGESPEAALAEVAEAAELDQPEEIVSFSEHVIEDFETDAVVEESEETADVDAESSAEEEIESAPEA